MSKVANTSNTGSDLVESAYAMAHKFDDMAEEEHSAMKLSGALPPSVLAFFQALVADSPAILAAIQAVLNSLNPPAAAPKAEGLHPGNLGGP